MAGETRSIRSASDRTGNPPPDVRSTLRSVFRKEGEYWTVGYAANPFRLKDSKGLGYLAHLIRHPGIEFHVLDLAGGLAGQPDEDEATHLARGLPHRSEELEKSGIHIASVGDAGEMLDEQAKAAYRRRLTELRGELEEAKTLGKIERAEQAEQEIDSLTRELSRAVGLGGRNRRAASATERARQTITKTIKSVLERIAQSDAALGDILSRCVRTGTFCSYQPEADFPFEWEFSAPIEELAEQHPASVDPASVPAEHRSTSAAVLEVSPFSVAERTTFVGREIERVAIRSVIDRALGGQGSLVMLGGGPGVGKSRLAMEMAEYASRVGFRCLVGHCYERDEPFPFLPFVEIIESGLAHAASLDDFRRRMGDNAAELAQIVPSLRRVFPDIPQPLELPAAQKRRYLFQSASEALRRAAQTRSQFHILEDLHWADESTLALLIHLANRISQLPIVIIGTYRDAYAENSPVFVRTLEELIRMGNRPLKLGGLSKDAITQMLHGLSNREPPDNLVSLIFEESQGYPFFVEEVYRHLNEEGKVFDAAGQFRTDIQIDEIDVPENVRLIIERRLERLDENEIRALAAAAVIGRSFSFQLLAAISQIDTDELFDVIEKAQQMGIIVPSSEGPEKPFTFAHELVRQTLLARNSAPRNQRLHANVADAIERIYPHGVNERAGHIADHLFKAGSFADSRRLVHYLKQAGKNALEAAAFEAARANFRSALSYQDAVGATERADLLANLATAERSLDQWDAALAHLDEALEIYIQLDDRKLIGKSFAELADALVWAGHFKEAVETARRGLASLEAGVSAERVRLLAVLGHSLAATEGSELAHEALREALNIASKLSDPKLVARVLGARSVANFHYSRLVEAANDGFESVRTAGAAASPWEYATHLRILQQTLLFLGRVEEAVRIGDELEPIARKIGQSYSVALSLDTRAWLEFGRASDLAKLETEIQLFSNSARDTRFPLWKSLSFVQLSLLDFFRGNWASALSHAQAGCRSEAGSSMEGLGLGMLFRQMAYSGDRDGALANLDANRERLPRSNQQNTRGSWWMLMLVIEGLTILGEHAQAALLYSLARQLIGTGVVLLWPIPRFAHTVAALGAAAAHEWAVAENHFRIALQQAESFPLELEKAEIQRFHAMMLLDRDAAGDRKKAKTLLSEALKTYKLIGMPRHLEMTQALME